MTHRSRLRAGIADLNAELYAAWCMGQQMEAEEDVRRVGHMQGMGIALV